jgi:hypothetical protein
MNGKKAWKISVCLLLFRFPVKALGQIWVTYVAKDFPGCAS